jgi:ribokinase
MSADLKKIVLIGDLCIDWFMMVPDYPQKGGDGMTTEMYQELGGSVSNTAIGLAHLGCRPILVTHAGADARSAEMLDKLETEGVCVDFVQQDQSDTIGTTLAIVTPDGERTMFTYRGANRRLSPADIMPELFTGASMLHISGYMLLEESGLTAVEKAAAIARDLNIPVSIDIGVEPAYKLGSRLTDLLANVTLLILGRDEARAIAGCDDLTEAMDKLLGYGVKILGLKVGAQGCHLIDKDHQVLVPGFPAAVIDTTGAGDAFSAGMIYGLTHGFPLAAAGTLANSMGAMLVSRKGAGIKMPDKFEIKDFLSQQLTQNPLNTELIQETLKLFRT